jgi:dipeptidyl aminopeptidase/acylaminoacyl peptidase
MRVASHTAGGIKLPGIIIGPAPSEAQARAIRTPYQLHHGDQDEVVPIAQDQRLDAVLQAGGVAHEFHVYPGVDHTDVATSPTVLARIRTWYSAYQVP